MSDAKKIAIIESPYAGDIERNTRYARAALRDSLDRGEAPYASHLLYTQEGVLRDELPAEREWGISSGFAFRRLADVIAVYSDLGISRGMKTAIDLEEARGTASRVVYRTLPGWVEANPPITIGSLFAAYEAAAPGEQKLREANVLLLRACMGILPFVAEDFKPGYMERPENYREAYERLRTVVEYAVGRRLPPK
jgi:hypothetical protein